MTSINKTSIPSPTAAPRLSPNEPASLGFIKSDATGTNMVYVPAGCFMMGSGEPPHLPIDFSGGDPFQMCFSYAYWIDKTPVTNAAYQKFIDAGGYKQRGTWWTDAGWNWLNALDIARPHNYDGFTDPQQPRVGEMWYEADAYCRWRGARLPTEPEWEYAARGPKNLIYPWGNTFDPSRVVYAANSDGKPAIVGSKPANASWVGALDMSGNVWQWTSTIYEEDDPTNPKSALIPYYTYPYPATNDGRERSNVNNTRVIVRGGSFDFPEPYELATYFRYASPPTGDYGDQSSIGFRCVRAYP